MTSMSTNCLKPGTKRQPISQNYLEVDNQKPIQEEKIDLLVLKLPATTNTNEQYNQCCLHQLILKHLKHNYYQSFTNTWEKVEDKENISLG